MTRRRFLKIVGLAGLTGWVGTSFGVFSRVLRWFDRSRSRVSLVACDGYSRDLRRRLELCWDLAPGPSVRGLAVVLKPNVVDFTRGLPINTDPRFLGALVDLIRERGAKSIVIAEGPGNRRDIETVLGESGLSDVLSARRVRFVDLNTDDVGPASVVTIPPALSSRLSGLVLPRTIVSADLVISVAKMKTHHWTGVTLSMKNLFGVVPGSIYGWPKNILHWNGIDRSVIELFQTVRPAFGLVDGIVGMEGDGPLLGTSRETGLILASQDLVALDAVAARGMGVEPCRIGYLAAAEELSLGRMRESRIDVCGGSLARLAQRFTLPAGFEHLRL